MCRQFALYSGPTKVARSLQSAVPGGVMWLNPGLENLDELRGMLTPSEKGTLERHAVCRDVGKVANDGKYLLELNSE